LATLAVEDCDVEQVVLHRLAYPDQFCNNTDRFQQLARSMVNKMIQLVHSPLAAEVWIEEYTFHVLSSSTTGICEVSSIFKLFLWQAGYTWATMSNTTPKRVFGGHGGANKLRMFWGCQRSYPFVAWAISKHFHWDCPTPLDKKVQGDDSDQEDQDKKKENKKLVPNPIQDIVDALAICFVGRSLKVDELDPGRQAKPL
jgi:Holliday junction resolvasome RuvABC endonuclease subunit